MPESIVIALITLSGTALTAWAAVRAANRLSNYRIEQLEKKMDAYNNVQRRLLTAEINICNIGAATGVDIMKGE